MGKQQQHKLPIGPSLFLPLGLVEIASLLKINFLINIPL
jgi:hypothetical protein